MKLRAMLWGLNLLLLGGAVLLTVHIAKALSQGTEGPLEVGSTDSYGGSAGALPPPDPQLIVERNPFAPLTEVTPLAPEEPAEELEESELPLDLIGTVAAEDPALSQAAVRNARTGETRVVGVGDALAPEAVALRIERRRLILLEDGDRRELRVEDRDPGPAGDSALSKRERVRRFIENYHKNRERAVKRRQQRANRGS